MFGGRALSDHWFRNCVFVIDAECPIKVIFGLSLTEFSHFLDHVNALAAAQSIVRLIGSTNTFREKLAVIGRHVAGFSDAFSKNSALLNIVIDVVFQGVNGIFM